MSLPPSTITVKRKREDDDTAPLNYIRLEHHNKKAKHGLDNHYIYQRQSVGAMSSGQQQKKQEQQQQHSGALPTAPRTFILKRTRDEAYGDDLSGTANSSSAAGKDVLLVVEQRLLKRARSFLRQDVSTGAAVEPRSTTRTSLTTIASLESQSQLNKQKRPGARWRQLLIQQQQQQSGQQARLAPPPPSSSTPSTSAWSAAAAVAMAQKHVSELQQWTVETMTKNPNCGLVRPSVHSSGGATNVSGSLSTVARYKPKPCARRCDSDNDGDDDDDDDYDDDEDDKDKDKDNNNNNNNTSMAKMSGRASSHAADASPAFLPNSNACDDGAISDSEYVTETYVRVPAPDMHVDVAYTDTNTVGKSHTSGTATTAAPWAVAPSAATAIGVLMLNNDVEEDLFYDDTPGGGRGANSSDDDDDANGRDSADEDSNAEDFRTNEYPEEEQDEDEEARAVAVPRDYHEYEAVGTDSDYNNNNLDAVSTADTDLLDRDVDVPLWSDDDEAGSGLGGAVWPLRRSRRPPPNYLTAYGTTRGDVEDVDVDDDEEAYGFFNGVGGLGRRSAVAYPKQQNLWMELYMD